MSKLSRRLILQQAGAWSLLWPLVRMQSVRAQSELAPRRVIIVFTPNGPIMEKGPASGTESDFQIHDWWAPLERHKKDGLFFSGLHQAGVPFGEHNEYGHQSAGTGALTARTTEGTNNSTGPSLDQFIGQGLVQRDIITPKRSLLWGVHDNTGNWGPWYETAGKPIGPTKDPFQALADLAPHLQQPVDPNNPSPVSPLLRKNFVLDHAYRDCKALLGNLSSEGKELLDFHCGNIESMQKSVTESLNRPQGPNCEAPGSPPNTTLSPGDSFGQAELNDELTKTFISMVPLAFGCDITRVMGFSFGGAAARFAIPSSYGIPSSEKVDSGDSGPQHHAWTHVYDDAKAPEKRVALKGFTTWYSEQVALLIDTLKATPDINGGSLFDSTLVLWTSELGWKSDEGPHSNTNIPVLLFGNGQGTMKTGRFYDAQGPGDETALVLHSLFVSLCRYAGLEDVDTFGNAGVGPLDWLAG